MEIREHLAAPSRSLAPRGGVTETQPFQGPRGTVTILLPTKDEEMGVARTLDALPLAELRASGFGVEVVVVDGRSTDRTLEVAAGRGARVIVQEGKGKGMAIRTARRYVRGRYVLMLDADDSYPAESIPQFLALLEAGADVVMGSRFRGEILDGAMSGVNRFGNRGLSLIATLLYRRRCTDVCTGMWGFRREAFLQIPLTSSAFEIEAEMFARFSKAGFNVVETPIVYRQRTGDTKLGKFKDGFRIATELVKQRLSFAPSRLPESAPAPLGDPRPLPDAAEPTPSLNLPPR